MIGDDFPFSQAVCTVWASIFAGFGFPTRPSLRRNGGSSFGAEFHSGLGMSLTSASFLSKRLSLLAGVVARRGVGILRVVWQWIGFQMLLSSETSDGDPPLPRWVRSEALTARRGVAQWTLVRVSQDIETDRHRYRYRVRNTGTVYTLIRIQHVMELPLR